MQGKSVTDADLLQAWLAGDRPAMAELFRRHVDAAYRLAKSRCGNDADAEDVVQLAFMQVCRRAGSFRRGHSARAWILRIVHNSCHNRQLEEYRRRHRQKQVGQEQAMVDDKDVAAELVAAEQFALVRTALADLPERYRLPVTLRYLEELPLEEVATILSRSPKTVESQLRRGLQKLQHILSGRGLVLQGGALLAVLAALPTVLAPARVLVHAQAVAASAPLCSSFSLVLSTQGMLMTSFCTVAVVSVLGVVLAGGQAGAAAVQEDAPPPLVAEVDSGAVFLERRLPVHLIRAELPEVMHELRRHLGSSFQWAYPVRDLYALPVEVSSKTVTIDARQVALSVRAICDQVAKANNLRWRLVDDVVVFLADSQVKKYKGIHTTVIGRAEAGDSKAIAALIDAALAGDAAAVNYITAQTFVSYWQYRGQVSYFVLAQGELGATAGRLRQRWAANDGLSAQLAAATRLAGMNEVLVEAVINDPPVTPSERSTVAPAGGVVTHLAAVANAADVDRLVAALPGKRAYVQDRIIRSLGDQAGKAAAKVIADIFSQAIGNAPDDREKLYAYNDALQLKITAAKALLRIDERYYLPMVLKELQQDYWPPARLDARWSLLNGVQTASAVEALLAQLDRREDQPLHQLVLEALGELRHPAARQALHDLVKQQESDDLAVYAAQQLARQHDVVGVQYLRSHLAGGIAFSGKRRGRGNGPSPWSMVNSSAYANSRLPAVEQHLHGMLVSNDAKEQSLALLAMPALRSPDSLALLRRVAGAAADDNNQRHAIWQLRGRPHQEGTQLLMQLVDDTTQDMQSRFAALHSLSSVVDDSTVAAFILKYARGSGRLAEAALRTLQSVTVHADEPLREQCLALVVQKAASPSKSERALAYWLATSLSKQFGITVAGMPDQAEMERRYRAKSNRPKQKKARPEPAGNAEGF